MKALLVTLLFLTGASTAQAVSWVFCAMQDTVRVARSRVLLADIAAGPLPADAGQLTISQAPAPGQSLVIRQRGVLRQLVTAGLAAGVRFQGAASTVVIRDGARLDRDTLRARARHLLISLLPPDEPGAPAGRFELDLPANLPTAGGRR